MREINRFSGLIIIGTVAMFLPSLAADVPISGDVATDKPDTAHYQPISNSCLGDNFYYCLPVDIDEERFQDEPIEIPVVKRMVFKFGKPQEKRFFV